MIITTPKHDLKWQLAALSALIWLSLILGFLAGYVLWTSSPETDLNYKLLPVLPLVLLSIVTHFWLRHFKEWAHIALAVEQTHLAVTLQEKQTALAMVVTAVRLLALLVVFILVYTELNPVNISFALAFLSIFIFLNQLVGWSHHITQSLLHTQYFGGLNGLTRAVHLLFIAWQVLLGVLSGWLFYQNLSLQLLAVWALVQIFILLSLHGLVHQLSFHAKRSWLLRH